MITFEIPGDPVAKGRPRMVKRGKWHKPFTPKATLDFENRVRFAAVNAGVVLLKGPVELTAQFLFACPKSRYRKREHRPREHRTQKPDLDNLMKSLMDGLNGIAYVDDSQVVRMVPEKFTEAQGVPARTIVTVRELEPVLDTNRPPEKEDNR